MITTCGLLTFHWKKLELSRAQNPWHVAWHLLHIQADNDNYIDLSDHMHASQAHVEEYHTSLEVE